MKRVITAAFCVVFIVNAAGAYTWRLVASYPTPRPNPRGYGDCGGTGGFIVDAGPTPYVYRFRLGTGSILSSFPAPGGAGAWGINTDPSDRMYVSNNRTSWIYRITSTGSVISSFRCPIAGPADLDYNVLWFYLYIAIPDKNVVAVVTTTGSLVGTFAAPGSRPTACCGYQTTLIADSATHTVYENGVPVITGIETPVGADLFATTGSDYDVLIFVADDTTDRIYAYIRAVTVAPASFGRVKALFK